MGWDLMGAHRVMRIRDPTEVQSRPKAPSVLHAPDLTFASTRTRVGHTSGAGVGGDGTSIVVRVWQATRPRSVVRCGVVPPLCGLSTLNQAGRGGAGVCVPVR